MNSIKRIALLTSGGDSPGMNAAIRSVTRSAIANGLDVVGFRRGYEGLLDGDGVPMTKSSVGGIIHRGGTILRTARSDRFRKPEGVGEAFVSLERYDIDALVVLGGDGSFRGAWNLHERGFPIAGIPCTIDNDIAGTENTIGFDTACNTALDAIEKLRDTASSHDRLFVVEVMGHRSGFLALAVGVASGAEYVVAPEINLSMEVLCEKLLYAHKRHKTHSLIILAEGVMSAQDLAVQIKDCGSYESRITVLGHIQRGGSPSCADAVLASRMGTAAVNGLLEGHKGFMVGDENDKMKLSPLNVSWESKKPLSDEMIALVETLSI